MTECSVSMCLPGLSYKNDASAGFLAGNAVVKIVDDEGNKLGPGERGEILVKSHFPFLVCS